MCSSNSSCLCYIKYRIYKLEIDMASLKKDISKLSNDASRLLKDTLDLKEKINTTTYSSISLISSVS